MPLLTLREVCLSYGGPLLLDHVDFQLRRGERVCLVGRNGAGKSTLMKLINGEHQADQGEYLIKQGVRVQRLQQEVPEGTVGNILSVVAHGLGELGGYLARYDELLKLEQFDQEFENLQHRIEEQQGWQARQQIDRVLSRLQLDPASEFNTLSGGWKRRVLLAQALVGEPDVLLLDEPTNHLDITAIEWLEEFLVSYAGTLLFITHDRSFLQRLATRIVELDRGKLVSFPGDYAAYLQRKEAMLQEEEQQNALFDKRLAQEEVWIRQGIKARRTRNEGRVRALEKMRTERSQRRNRQGQAKIGADSGERSGKLVIEAQNICYHYDDQPIVRDFSVTIMRGDKIGIIGPNGAGKSTLLAMLLGRLVPQAGEIKSGTNLQVAYFDQLRQALNEEATVFDMVAEGKNTVILHGKERHVMSYLQDFLFAPERARSPVKALSGGERNRLLLAKLFTQPCNVLVLDEPTNDLDMETLDLLEELLLDYQGTLLLVSHDRAFLNDVVTSTLVFEGMGLVNEYVGGYDDWLRQRSVLSQGQSQAQAQAQAQIQNSIKNPAGSQVENCAVNKNNTMDKSGVKEQKKKLSGKLSFKEKQELEALPAKIEQLEHEQEELNLAMANGDFYQQESDVIRQATTRMATLEEALLACYERWETLDAKIK
ncbi:ABC transporter ATP-binding protein uup [Piscirickettsia salmonis]|uniref:ATP-binding protein Uup n=1 Tax=Piscirickettsia salmonis TaxID=1238 RepID=A0A1L6TAU5_PISSA|nr:ATP-binding cassette domain-containing protein [Piscirickettsia salmonis]AKP73644.1 ABC transporter ATP-binding protein [Piscirickettsia salmonis LF-89 = ATCC VR-1361]ALB22422.1 ABC transporter ATPase [Piscirickettsia salmonis]ALY02493.1 ABC transporter ATP-binding protein [Piscirickettsia salmonis]AMA42014.1 ABC transporter ATP-binding protein [Piscirickettsia salmonis]AOS34484.1 ABC transporter ATP-binding protein [Piscirickettsia salmonis]